MLEPLKSVLPIIYNMQLDMLNNSRLHNKMNKTLSQVKAVAATTSPAAAAADAADAVRADLSEPLAAAECLATKWRTRDYC